MHYLADRCGGAAGINVPAGAVLVLRTEHVVRKVLVPKALHERVHHALVPCLAKRTRREHALPLPPVVSTDTILNAVLYLLHKMKQVLVESIGDIVACEVAFLRIAEDGERYVVGRYNDEAVTDVEDIKAAVAACRTECY